MQDVGEAAVGGGEAVILQFLPLFIVSVIYAFVVFVIARKRKVNPWPWTIGTLIPGVGIIVAPVFMLLSFISVFDRLNALEGPGQF